MEQKGAEVYSSDASERRSQIDAQLESAPEIAIEGNVLAVIVPDSNLIRGGRTSASVYRAIARKSFDSVVIVGSHSSDPSGRISVCRQDVYVSPLGEVKVNDRLKNELCDEDDDIYLDDMSHFQERGIGTQLPFLQSTLDEFSLVPVIMGQETPELSRELGMALGEIMFNRPTLIVACVDLIHATPGGLARLREGLESCDVDDLMRLLSREDDLQLVGRGALLAALIAAVRRRAKAAHILSVEPPTADAPGFIGAVITRS